MPAALVRDRQYRQAYSGVEVSGAGAGDSILIRVDSRESTEPPTYFGNNRGHYNSPRLDQLHRSLPRECQRAGSVPGDEGPVRLLGG